MLGLYPNRHVDEGRRAPKNRGVLARILSTALLGVEAVLVRVEVDVARGLPAFTTVGLPDSAVRESRERVKTSIRNGGYAFPNDRVTVNLAPADLRKEGSAFDLPIALGILTATGIVKARTAPLAVVGELALDGQIQPVRGVLAAALTCRRERVGTLLVPVANRAEAAAVSGLDVLAASTLRQAVALLNGEAASETEKPVEAPIATTDDDADFADVRGQAHAKRALEIAAAGNHNVILLGPPGGGKTMLARRLPGILPPLTTDEAIEISTIWSVAGLLAPRSGLCRTRPFRAPHHTISVPGLIGGGGPPHPGEVTLAHRGVLFLDELPEFQQHVLESLRQPLEDGCVTIARASGTGRFPARFQLVAAANPCRRGCPCLERCLCSPAERSRYLGRLSRPLLDRIDLQVELPAVPPADLQAAACGENSSTVRARVFLARTRQRERYHATTIRVNAELTPRQVRRDRDAPPPAEGLVGTAQGPPGPSTPGHPRLPK